MYGKSNDKYSWLRDSKYTLKITINGQLLLTMLAEKIVDSIDDVTMLQINTDGLTVKLKSEDKDTLLQICKNWEKLTNLELEYFYYDRMIIRDVNNYIGIYKNPEKEPKLKGFFEIEREPHKDHSMKIVRKAVVDYYVNGSDYTETIKNHNRVEDFFKAVKSKKGSKFEFRYYDNKEVIVEPLTKTVRYLVTNNGKKLLKVLPPNENKKDNIEKIKEYSPNQLNIFDIIEDDFRIELDRDVEVEAGYLSTLYNKYSSSTPIFEYDINYDYYINECEKVIKKIGKK